MEALICSEVHQTLKSLRVFFVGRPWGSSARYITKDDHLPGKRKNRRDINLQIILCKTQLYAKPAVNQ